MRIQAWMRGFLAKRRYKMDLRRVVICQNLVRKYAAKKELKKLKIEAKSISKQRELNKGLENKIMLLQQRLTESKDELKVTTDGSIVLDITLSKLNYPLLRAGFSCFQCKKSEVEVWLKLDFAWFNLVSKSNPRACSRVGSF